MGLPAWINSLPDAGIKADLSTYAANGTLTYAAAVQILTDVADRGAVTAAELSSLQTIAANLNNGLSTPAYVATAFTQIVDGNPANAVWNGGSPTAVALGDLEVGSTSAQLSKLIGEWLLGTDMPDPTLPPGSGGPEPTYAAVAGPLYGSTGAASVADICQGEAGDCELLAELIEMVDNHPSQLSSMVVDDGNGTYGVRFYVNGDEIWETVNDELPVVDGTLAYAHNYNSANTALWVPLIEKAYAQLSGTGLIDHPAVDSYNNIDGDSSSDVMPDLTDCTNVTYYWSSSAGWYADETTYLDALADGDGIILETPDSGSDTYDNSGHIELIPDHAFAVVGYDSSTGDFIVRNPWGNSYPGQNWDVQFEVSLAQIATDGGDFAIDNSGTDGSTILVTSAAQQVSSSGSPVAGLFRVTNSSGAPITEFTLRAEGSVSIQLNGALNLATAAETAEGEVVISATDLSKVTLSASATSGTADLLVSASDGASWSATTDISLTLSAGAAVTQPLDVAVAAGATVALSGLFHVSGAMGAGATIQVDLPTGNGVLNLNGAKNFSSSSGVYLFYATQLSSVTYTAPATDGTAQLQFIVDNGSTWSPWLDETLTVGVDGAAAAAQNFENGRLTGAAHVVDTAADIFANLDTLQDAFAAGVLQTIALSDATPPMETLSAAEYARDLGLLSILTGREFEVAVPSVGSSFVATFDISGQSYTGMVETYDSAGDERSIEYEGMTGQAYDAVKYFYAGAAASGYQVTGWDVYYTDQPSGLIEQDFSAAGNLSGEAFAGAGGQGQYSSLRYDLTGSAAIGYSNSGVEAYYSNQASGLIEVDYDGGGNLVRELYAFASAGPGSLTGLEIDYVVGREADSLYSYAGPGGTSYTTAVYAFGPNGGYTGATYSFTGSTYDQIEASFTPGASPTLTETTYGQYTGSGGPNVVSYFYSGGALADTEETFTGVTGQAYTTVTEDYAASGAVASSQYSGFSGKPYNSLTYFDNASGAVQTVVRNYHDGAETLDGRAYDSHETISNASGALLATAYHLDSGGNVYVGDASGVASPILGGSGVSANAAQTSYALSGGDWTITGGGTNESFSFASLFNTAEITDYGSALGAGAPDHITLAAADFGGWTTFLGEGAASGAGGVDTTFTSTTTGDKLTLDGATLAQVSALKADFAFV
jgi:hypothetical protein